MNRLEHKGFHDLTKKGMKILEENRGRERKLWIAVTSQSFLPVGVQLGSRQGGSGGACDQGAARAIQ